MKTDELITWLARGAGAAPAPRALVARTLAPAAAVGVVIAALLAVTGLGRVPAALLAAPAWWVKFGYALAIAGVAGWLLSRLARPAMSLSAPRRALLAVPGLLALAALGQLGVSAREAWPGLWLGHSAIVCPVAVLVLSLPALVLALAAVRRLAPVRLRAAGAAAGLLAGGLGAAGYALTCSEVGLPFVVSWYTLGMTLATAVGAALGPRLLRW